MFVGFDGDELVILPFGGEGATWFAWLCCIALVGMVTGVTTSQT